MAWATNPTNRTTEHAYWLATSEVSSHLPPFYPDYLGDVGTGALSMK